MSTKTKTFEECCDEIEKLRLLSMSESWLCSYFKEAAELYASEKIKRAIELARRHEAKWENKQSSTKYTEQEILELLNQNKLSSSPKDLNEK